METKSSPTYTANASYTVQNLRFTFTPSEPTDLSGATLTLRMDFTTTLGDNPLTLTASVTHNSMTGATTGGISETLSF